MISSYVIIACYHVYPLQTRAVFGPTFFCDKAYILTKKLNLVFHRSYTIQKIVCAFGDYVKLKFERFHCRGVVCIQQFKGTVFLSKNRRLLLIMVERNGRRIRVFYLCS